MKRWIFIAAVVLVVGIVIYLVVRNAQKKKDPSPLIQDTKVKDAVTAIKNLSPQEYADYMNAGGSSIFSPNISKDGAGPKWANPNPTKP